MTANAIKVEDRDLAQKDAPKRKRPGRELTLDMIKPTAKGAPVAKYIYPYIKTSGVTNNDLAEALGYENHSNMSMVRSGAARLPVSKAPAAAEFLKIDDRFEFGLLVAENNMPEDVMALQRLGVIVSKQERELLDLINAKVPKGDMKEFKKGLIELLDSF